MSALGLGRGTRAVGHAGAAALAGLPFRLAVAAYAVKTTGPFIACLPGCGISGGGFGAIVGTRGGLPGPGIRARSASFHSPPVTSAGGLGFAHLTRGTFPTRVGPRRFFYRRGSGTLDSCLVPGTGVTSLYLPFTCLPGISGAAVD